MSSHREAPEISKDPTADSTDVYAWVDPNSADMVTMIANYIPLQGPDGGPNFYEFDDNVTYYINIDNVGNGRRNIAYQFKFTTVNQIPTSFLYNDGPITALTGQGAAAWNRKQTYTLKRLEYGLGDGTSVTSTATLGTNLTVPPCNIGPLSTPNYQQLGNDAIHFLNSGSFKAKVFAGQRAEGFYVDLGAVFDLGNLRPFDSLHEGFKATGIMGGMPGVNSTDAVNVHSLCVQVPITDVTNGGTRPAGPRAANAVIGVWTSATRPASRMYNPGNDSNGTGGGTTNTGGEVQVSRLANPLVNELLIGIGDKDAWNSLMPEGDVNFYAKYLKNPLLAQLLPVLYPGAFPNLAKYNAGTGANAPNRADLAAILFTGIPSGVVKGFAGNHLAQSGVVADELRLNVAIPPTPRGKASNLGLIGGDVAGFPNGRRVFDDVATIELRAVAGATLPLTDKKYKADTAAGEVSFGLTSSPTDLTAKGTEFYNVDFPFLGRPHAGWDAHTARAVNGAVADKY